MAHEFHYSISLSIVHPTVDPQSISEVIFNLRPRIQTATGSIRRGKDGQPLVPNRKALLSHWLADLHEAERLYSGDIPLSDFILSKLNDLTQYQSFFTQLRTEGE